MATVTAIKQKILQLDAGGFQILCDAYLGRVGYRNIVALGTQAGTQKTTKGTPDTYFTMQNGKYILVEYTTQQSGLEGKILEDLEKCFNIPAINADDIIEIVYCHTSSNISVSADKKLRQYCQDRGVQLTLIGIDTIASDIARYYPVLAKDHLGISIDTEQIQSPVDFVKQYDANPLAAPLDTDFQFREDEIKNLNKAFESTSIVVLSGAAGTGKTRLSIEYARIFEEHNHAKTLIIHSKNLPIFDDLKRYLETPGCYFIVVDDANQLTHLDLITEYVNKRDEGFDVKLLLSVRNYALESVRSKLQGKARYAVEELGKFSDDEIKFLVEKKYGINTQFYLERIVEISEGNARIAMFAGKIAAETNKLESIKDVTNLYDEYFGKAFTDANLDNSEQLQVTAGILAFLSSVHFDYLELFGNLLSEHRMQISDFINCAHKLNELELVDVYQDKAAAISDQCFANYILKRVFVDKKAISFAAMLDLCFEKFKNKTLNAVGTLMRIFQSKEVQDFVSIEVKKVWEKRKTESYDKYWNWVKVFYPFDTEEALLLISDKIEKLEPVDLPVEEIDFDKGKNCQVVNDELIKTLGGFANIDNSDAALELLIKYYLKRPDLYMEFFHCINMHYGVTRWSSYNDYAIQVQLVDQFIECSDNWENSYLRALFVEIAKELLKLMFSPSEPGRGNSIVLYYVPLSSESNPMDYRSMIWEQLGIVFSKGESKEKLRKIIEDYACPLGEISHGVVVEDAHYICKLIQENLSPDDINDCIAVKHIANVFEICGYPEESIGLFLHSRKMKNYELLFGPKWEANTAPQERDDERKRHIIEYLENAENQLSVFNEMIGIYTDRYNASKRDSYDLSDGLMDAINYMLADKENCLQAAELVVRSSAIDGLGTCHIISKLFELLQPEEVEALLRCAPIETLDIWLYAFYREYPNEMINNSVLVNMYNYLEKDYDRQIHLSEIRRLDFLKKYEKEDPCVFVNGAKRILAKKEYSPFIVQIYFDSLFNPYTTKPLEVMDWFKSDISLLEEIYSFECYYDSNTDHDGAFFKVLTNHRPGFAKSFVLKWLQEKRRPLSNNETRRLQTLFDLPDCFELIDELIEDCANELPDIPVYHKLFTEFIKIDSQYKDMSDAWINHYIQTYNDDFNKMSYLFEILSELHPDRKKAFYKLLIETNDDPELFEQITLCSPYMSWTGSVAPVYTERISFLEELRGELHGMRHIRHKKRINDTIESLKAQMDYWEVREALDR